MKREQIEKWINEGFHVLENGRLIKVEGDLWYYLDTIDEEDTGVLVLEDIVKWSDDEISQLQTTYS